MVSKYSRCAITYDTDRLPALAGIAADTTLLLGVIHHSGIWEKALHSGVLYQASGELSTWEEPPEPHPLWEKVPSWSWAALGRPIIFVRPHQPPQTQRLCDIQILLRKQGQLSVLEMVGPLMRLDWAKTSRDNVQCQAVYKPGFEDPIIDRWFPHNDDLIWDILVKEDLWFAQKCYAEFCVQPIPGTEGRKPSKKPSFTALINKLLIYGRPRTKKGFTELLQEAYIAALFDRVFFIPVLYAGVQTYKTVRSFSGYGWRTGIIGLLPWAEPGLGKGTFRGFETVTLQARVKEDPLFLLKDRLDTYQATICEEDYVHFDGTVGYTIQVV